MTARFNLTPFAGEAEAGDPANAGEWADEVARMAADALAPPWCNYLARRDGIAVGIGGR